MNPKDRRVVISESVFSPTVFRETLAKVLFLHYEVKRILASYVSYALNDMNLVQLIVVILTQVSSVLYVPAHLMALYTLGISSALVMDFGYLETVVVPVFEGVVMVNSSNDYSVGGATLHRCATLILYLVYKLVGLIERIKKLYSVQNLM